MNYYIVDDDHAVASSLRFMLTTTKLFCQTFTSGEDFLARQPRLERGCVILDMQLGGISGLEVQIEMRRRQLDWPIVFLSGHCSVPAIVDAMKHGAVDYVIKPSSDMAILETLQRAACSAGSPTSM